MHQFSHFIIAILILALPSCIQLGKTPPETTTEPANPTLSGFKTDITDIPQGASTALDIHHPTYALTQWRGDTDEQFYVASSVKDGLLLLDASGKVIQQEKMSARAMDTYRDSTTGIHYVIILDYSKNKLGFFQLTHTPPALKFVGDISLHYESFYNLCTYTSPINGFNYLFLTHKYGLIEQWLITIENTEPKAQKIRDFHLSAEITNCATVDELGWLLIAEEELGIWRYGAEPENKIIREPIALIEPFGDIPEKIATINTYEGILYVLSDLPSVHAYSLNPNLEDSLFPLEQQFSALLTHESETVMISSPPTSSEHWLSFAENGSSTLYTQALQVTLPSLNPPKTIPTIPAHLETDPMRYTGDSLDDPAIWINRKHPEKSLILGSNKREGLVVFNLKGKLIQELATGQLNNVDIRQSVKLGEQVLDIAAASNRTDNSVALYSITPNTPHVALASSFQTPLSNIYGICMYQSASDETYVFVNDKSGLYLQYRLYTGPNGLSGEMVRSFKLPSQPEGCVAHDEKGLLFAGEENEGIWMVPANPKTTIEPSLIAKHNDILVPDIEGLSIYIGEKADYLVASSQGNDTYVVYKITDGYPLMGAFAIGMNVNKGIDGASETDGLDSTSVNLGGPWEKGFLVVHDGRNLMPRIQQNFKLIPFKDILESLNLE